MFFRIPRSSANVTERICLPVGNSVLPRAVISRDLPLVGTGEKASGISLREFLETPWKLECEKWTASYISPLRPVRCV